MKILCIEADARLQHALSTQLEELGHQCQHFSDGSSACGSEQLKSVDLCIVGHCGDDEKALSICTRLRECFAAIPQWTPILLLQADFSPEAVQKAMQAGIDDVLPLPVMPTDLAGRLTALERLVGMRHELTALDKTIARRNRIDRQTGMHNRQSLEDLARREWDKITTRYSPMAAITLRVEALDNYREHYGDDYTAACIQQVAAAIRSCIQRRADILSHVEEDCFVVVLPNTHIEGLQVLMQAISAEIAALHIPHAGQRDDILHTRQTGIFSAATFGRDFQAFLQAALCACDEPTDTGEILSLPSNIRLQLLTQTDKLGQVWQQRLAPYFDLHCLVYEQQQPLPEDKAARLRLFIADDDDDLAKCFALYHQGRSQLPALFVSTSDKVVAPAHLVPAEFLLHEDPDPSRLLAKISTLLHL